MVVVSAVSVSLIFIKKMVNSSVVFFFSSNGNLRNCLTMTGFLTNRKVRQGFVAMNTKTRELTMAVAVSEIDPEVLLDFECVKLPVCDDPDSNQEPLDQEFKLEEALRVSMDADQVQTKHVKKRKRKVIPECNSITFFSTSTRLPSITIDS